MAKTNDGELNVSPAAQAAIHSAVALLAPHASEPRIAALTSKLQAIGSPVGEGAEGVSKAIRGVNDLLKSEDLPLEAQRNLAKSSRDLQLEVLRQQNPKGAYEYEIAHGLRPAPQPGETWETAAAA